MPRLAQAIISGLVVTMLATTIHARQGEPSDPAPAPPGFAKDIRPLLKIYCVECHSPTKRRGGLDLETIEGDGEALELTDLWDQVGERLAGKEMPPTKSRQPSDEERRLLSAWIKHVAESRVPCDELTEEQIARSTTGYTNTRRLNRTEYNNTLRDLLGVDRRVGDLLPSEGGGGEGFDNTGSTLFTTPALMEKYLEAGDLALGTLLPDPGRELANAGAEAAELAEARHRLLGEMPGMTPTPRAAAEAVIMTFLPRAFHRPVEAREVGRYLGVFDKAAGRGLPYEQALKSALKAILVSPSFLFLTETPPEKSGAYRLDQHEVATHLSYFLWASMPDAELTRLAASGLLHSPEVLRTQVQRMMRDPKARGMADGFAAQWLGIRALGTTVRPDAKLFPEFTEELAAAMREETLLFFDNIVREDRSVLEFLDARYTFVNEVLAAHYGIEGVKGPEMRRVELGDLNRGGVMGQASVLTVTSYPHRTSPVLRGRWILEELLGAEVPPPPPDVPVLNERRKNAEKKSVRQLLETHRSKSECAACHSRIDPLGFGFEEFDPLGRWRTESAGEPVDSSGKLPTGEEFRGPAELKAILLGKRRTEFLRNLSRKMLGYALAREVNRADMCIVDGCVKALEEGGFRPSRLLEEVVVSYPFLHRYREE